MKNLIETTRFISFEGIDFSGKTTQIELLEKYLNKKGFQVYILREPGGTVISEKIRDLLLDIKHDNMDSRAEMFLYSAARVQLLTEKIIPLLKNGYYVLADRYVDSTTAYQGYGREIEISIIKKINQAATFDILPGITFYLEIDPLSASKRRINSGRSEDRLESAGIEFYQRVFEGYKKIAADEPERIKVLDATLPVNLLHEQIIKKITLQK
ncbi:MAG: dTMP kinase [Calditrichaceae bacterium]